MTTKYYGIDSTGRLQIPSVETLPTYDYNIHKGKLYYQESDDVFYFGYGDFGGQWINMFSDSLEPSRSICFYHSTNPLQDDTATVKYSFYNSEIDEWLLADWYLKVPATSSLPEYNYIIHKRTLYYDETTDKIYLGTGNSGGQWIEIFSNSLSGNSLLENLDLNNQSILYGFDELSNNQTASGDIIIGTAGEDLEFGDICYLNSDQTFLKADNSDLTTSKGLVVLSIALSVSGGVSSSGNTTPSGSSGLFLLRGLVRDDDYSLTSTEELYLSTNGTFTETRPEENILRKLGYAKTSNYIWFDPDKDYKIITQSLTISSDAITVNGSGIYILTPESGSPDDLLTINGGSVGDEIILCPVEGGETITVKNTDNIYITHNVDLQYDYDLLRLIKMPTKWVGTTYSAYLTTEEGDQLLTESGDELIL